LPNGPPSRLNGFGFATSGPAIDGVVIAVEAGASGTGVTPGGGGGTSGAGCCADAETAAPKVAAMARVATPLGSVVKIRFIGFFPLTQAAVMSSSGCKSDAGLLAYPDLAN
jgi:hypothetical protein